MQRELNKIIQTCLFGPAGGPDKAHLAAGRVAFELAKNHNLVVEDEKLVKSMLGLDNNDD